MTPAARVAAAIDVLDAIIAGAAAERTLIQWARGNRYAGSGDRAAIRDHVFDALRRLRSFAALGGGAMTGRAVMIGALRHAGLDPARLFDGQGHAPAPLTAPELAVPDLSDQPDALRLDMPDWLFERFVAGLGIATATAVTTALQDRAPVFLRVNLRKGTVVDALAVLAADAIGAVPLYHIKTAVKVTDNARKIKRSRAYADGLVELQDAASQAAVLRLPLRAGMRVLDYCSGGGGKALAVAALHDGEVVVHDIDAGRMADIPTRAKRAGVTLPALQTAALAGAGGFDFVMVDAPCSGSGTWRRVPDAKWRLTPKDLAQFCRLQAEVLDAAQGLVRRGGILAYMTCSVLNEENGAAITSFLARNPGFSRGESWQWLPGADGDGFYLATLCRG
ncbi:MAG: RsmB/NOP family class I SAM-dependent RNA methyltransferase [Rhodobacterales bacterium]|nr:RsmB/NOP family class I SAM-dependent RNA methyltransferase [Rhodobacterales bacterium]NCO85728.1 RsmB/NOP family class I SAM-dependent RNA methyltransferase [Rhodobacterales bacterium]NCT11544.1 RsmB/NOP family class I SAM-dependent RNA methyltransferase [Rhodobacterales bacterium]